MSFSQENDALSYDFYSLSKLNPKMLCQPKGTVVAVHSRSDIKDFQKRHEASFLAAVMAVSAFTIYCVLALFGQIPKAHAANMNQSANYCIPSSVPGEYRIACVTQDPQRFFVTSLGSNVLISWTLKCTGSAQITRRSTVSWAGGGLNSLAIPAVNAAIDQGDTCALLLSSELPSVVYPPFRVWVYTPDGGHVGV